MIVNVKFDGVSKILGNSRAVDDLHLEIGAGELFFLLGPSGCGKTTALRMVAGFYRPDEGRILFNGKDQSRVPPHKRNTGMVFQNYALWPHMDVRSNVAYGLKMRGVSAAEKEQRVGRALEIVQMRAYAERMPNQLSGGQQQRVALARALVIEPDVVLLDEPLSNRYAHTDQGYPPQSRPDDDLRDSRPGRSIIHGGSYRGDAPWPACPGRNTPRTLCATALGIRRPIHWRD